LLNAHVEMTTNMHGKRIDLRERKRPRLWVRKHTIGASGTKLG
jgi:hypothetical protein